MVWPSGGEGETRKNLTNPKFAFHVASVSRFRTFQFILFKELLWVIRLLCAPLAVHSFAVHYIFLRSLK